MPITDNFSVLTSAPVNIRIMLLQYNIGHLWHTNVGLYRHFQWPWLWPRALCPCLVSGLGLEAIKSLTGLMVKSLALALAFANHSERKKIKIGRLWATFLRMVGFGNMWQVATLQQELETSKGCGLLNCWEWVSLFQYFACHRNNRRIAVSCILCK